MSFFSLCVRADNRTGMELNTTWLQLLEPRIKSSNYLKHFGISNRGGKEVLRMTQRV